MALGTPPGGEADITEGAEPTVVEELPPSLTFFQSAYMSPPLPLPTYAPADLATHNQVIGALRDIMSAPLTTQDIISSLLVMLKNMGTDAFLKSGVGGYISNHFNGNPDLPMLDQALISQLETPAQLRLYLTLATNENFGNWTERLAEASSTIKLVNDSNENLQLKTDYDLAAIIQALAATNPQNPELTFQAIERMKQPRLVIVPAGLTLDHLRQQLTINNRAPYINDLYEPETARSTAAVYLIEAGDIRDMNTQPEAVQNAANEIDNNTLTLQRLREEAEKAGLHSDEHAYGMLAAMLRAQDPTLRIDPSTYSVLLNRFTDDKIVAYACFRYRYVFDADVYDFPGFYARVRPAVMAEI